MNEAVLKNRIRGERIQMNLTQQELGQKVDASRKQIGSWERSTSHISVVDALKLCDVFGCSLEYLFCKTDQR